MRTPTDLKDFGFCELKMAADLLRAYCESPPQPPLFAEAPSPCSAGVFVFFTGRQGHDAGET